MKAETYRDLLAVARRHVRVAGEGEDLVQDALLAAVAAGRFDIDAERKWLAGVIRNKAAMIARGEGRRRARESRRKIDPPGRAESPGEFFQAFPRSARTVAILVLHGMNPDEICQALDLSPEAFRQRLTSVRREAQKLSPAMRREALASAFARSGADLDLGPLRRALLACVRERPGIGFHDPDGHLIVVAKSSSHSRPSRQR